MLLILVIDQDQQTTYVIIYKFELISTNIIELAHMASLSSNQETFISSLYSAEAETKPYNYWNLDNVLDQDVLEGILDLPIEIPRVEYDEGQRAANNGVRGYFDISRREEFEVCEVISATFQSRKTISTIENICNINLKGSFLRVEYAQDHDGFWLEPHKDISVKLFSMLIYLSPAPDGEEWGTDFYTGPKQSDCCGTASHAVNRAFVFIPGANSWHGFRPRKITGVRRSLIVNFVTDKWMNRHELADPSQPIS